MTFTEFLNFVSTNGPLLLTTATTIAGIVAAVWQKLRAGKFEDGLKVATASIQAQPPEIKADLIALIQKVGKDHGVEDSVMSPLVSKVKAFLNPAVENPKDAKLESIINSVAVEVKRKSRQTPPPNAAQ